MNDVATHSPLDRRLCDRARETRDPRFDGLFFIAVTSTRIYCRPVCPAPSPKSRNIRYYGSAAAAAAAGFRPCLRCRPEAAPGSPLHGAKSDLVAGALRLIEQGSLDETSLPDLARRVGVGERHLRRLFAEELGASPIEVAATRRLLFAKKLLTETALPISAIAPAAGYASQRRFNAAFRATYGKPPREIRRATMRTRRATSSCFVCRIARRTTSRICSRFWKNASFRRVESVDANGYRRSFFAAGSPGWLSVAPIAGQSALALRVHHAKPSALGDIVARVRRMFDVDADPLAINAHLRRSALLKPLVRRWPGQRLPNAWDGFELAVRAILGQQVSVAAARTLAAVSWTAMERDSKMAHRLACTDCFLPPTRSSMRRSKKSASCVRVRTRSACSHARSSPVACTSGRSKRSLRSRKAMVALPGIGSWTAHYVAMRALGQPMHFLRGSILRRAAGDGITLTTRRRRTISEGGGPGDAYAVMLLWRSQG